MALRSFDSGTRSADRAGEGGQVDVVCLRQAANERHGDRSLHPHGHCRRCRLNLSRGRGGFRLARHWCGLLGRSGRLRCCAPNRCLSDLADHDEHLTNIDAGSHRTRERKNGPTKRHRYLDNRLLGLDLTQHLIGINGVPNRHMPFDDLRLLETGADIGESEFSTHQSSITLRTASTMSLGAIFEYASSLACPHTMSG